MTIPISKIIKANISKANLTLTKKSMKPMYQIDAKINGNRFVGTAKSLIDDNTNTAPLSKSCSPKANPNNPDPNSDTLEGGFMVSRAMSWRVNFYPMTTHLMWSLVANETKRPNLSPQKRWHFSAGFENPAPVLWIMKQLVELLTVKS